MLVQPGVARSLFYCFNAESSPNLLFGMGQRPFQVNLHCMSASVWLPLLNGLKNRRVLLCVGQQQCLCSSCRDVEHPNLRAGSRSSRRGEEWIVCRFGNHSMKGSIALAPLLALLGLRAPILATLVHPFVKRDVFSLPNHSLHQHEAPTGYATR
jgi:hypothetical protein